MLTSHVLPHSGRQWHQVRGYHARHQARGYHTGGTDTVTLGSGATYWGTLPTTEGRGGQAPLSPTAASWIDAAIDWGEWGSTGLYCLGLQDEGGIYLNELPPAATATHQTLTSTASIRLHRLLRLQPSLNQRR